MAVDAAAVKLGFRKGQHRIGSVRVAWISTALGAYSTALDELPTCELLSLKVVPGSGGTQPANLFDLTLVDEDGLDLLGGRGADLSNAAPTLLQFDPPLAFPGGVLTPTIANAGNAKTGTLELVVR